MGTEITRVEMMKDRADVDLEPVLVDVDGKEVEATMQLKVTHEGLIIDIVDLEGDVIRSAYQTIDDLVGLTH